MKASNGTSEEPKIPIANIYWQTISNASNVDLNINGFSMTFTHNFASQQSNDSLQSISRTPVQQRPFHNFSHPHPHPPKHTHTILRSNSLQLCFFVSCTGESDMCMYVFLLFYFLFLFILFLFFFDVVIV